MRSASIAVMNADIRTMDEDAPRARAVLIRDGVIDAVGSDAQIHTLAQNDDIEILDAGGHTVLPGFIDAHTHMELACYSLEHWPQAHTPPLASLEEVSRESRSFLKQHPGGDFILVRSSFGMHTKVEE